MIVAFEGMDGCGKSSTAIDVAKKLNFKHESQRMVSIMGIEEENFKRLSKKARTSTNEKLSFFLYTLRCMFDIESNENLVVERTMMSTYYFEHNSIDKEEFDFVMKYGVIPDITFVLYASSKERYRRILVRNPNDQDLKSKEALNDGYPLMIEFAKKYNMPYIGIDTEKYTHEEIVNICTDIINNLRRMNPLEIEGYIERMNQEFGFDNKYKNIERKLTYGI